MVRAVLFCARTCIFADPQVAQTGSWHPIRNAAPPQLLLGAGSVAVFGMGPSPQDETGTSDVRGYAIVLMI
jgi:hypothetical protein